MITYATSRKGLTENEIRLRGNISKPELSQIPLPPGRFQLRPMPAPKRSRWGGNKGSSLTPCETHISFPVESQTWSPPGFPLSSPQISPRRSHLLEPRTWAKTGGRRRESEDGVRTGCSGEFIPRLGSLEPLRLETAGAEILLWNSDSIPLSVSAQRPVSARTGAGNSTAESPPPPPPLSLERPRCRPDLLIGGSRGLKLLARSRRNSGNFNPACGCMP